MGIVGNTVGNIINTAVGSSDSGTTLYDFLSKFTSSAGKFVDQVDPLTTFDVSIKFWPTNPSSTDNSKSDVLDALGTAVTGAVTNLANNATGGLLTSLLNSGKSIYEQHSSFKNVGKNTFMEYLTEAHMLVGGENWFADQSAAPLELALGPYVQNITIPSMSMVEVGKANTYLGEIPLNGNYIKPDTNELVMGIVNTKASLHERIFYPWMKEVTLPYWSYDSQPYTTATITVDYTKHNDVKYVFCGCRPNKIFMLQGNQDTSSAENITRQVSFLFDFMFIISSLEVVESATDKLMSTAGAIAGSAANVLNI